MYITVRSNLVYQKNALELLHVYLQSEYQWLQYGNFARVEYLEKAIIRLVQNAFDNHLELRELLGDLSVREFAAKQDEQLGPPILDLLRGVESAQEKCRAQAALNRALSRALDEEHMERIGAAYGVPPQVLDLGPAPRVH